MARIRRPWRQCEGCSLLETIYAPDSALLRCCLQAPDELQAALEDSNVAEERGYRLQVRSMGGSWLKLQILGSCWKLLGAAQALW